MSRRLQHPDRRPAVIAGASSGIGAATAVALARAGHPVALGARRTQLCDDVARAIRDAGGEAVAHPLDVADSESVAKFASAVGADLGDIEVVVSNAGLSRPNRVHTSTVEELLAHVEVNLLGPQRLIEAFAPGLVARGRGDLVFISSDVVETVRPLTGAYNATKAGLEGLVHTMQRELEGTGVRASLVRPGPTLTEMGTDWPEDQTTDLINEWVKWGLARHGRFLPADAIASAVTTIVSAPRGTHITLMEVQPEAPKDAKDLP
ncbi:MAG: short-chain dehydrogenase [Marmoricola sp.]|nr:short-chain dehydrogenase [Marmoricola sp.]